MEKDNLKIQSTFHYSSPTFSDKLLISSEYIGTRINSLNPITEILIPILFTGILGDLLGGSKFAICAMFVAGLFIYIHDRIHNHMGP